MRKFNLSLDDFSPHPRAGLNFESIVWCNKLIEKYPDIKINLFVPAAYCRLGEKPYKLSEHPEWVEKVQSSVGYSNNYYLCYHGYYHRRFAGDFNFHGKHPKSNNDEWQYLTRDEANTLIDLMEEEFSGRLSRCKCFRPPGWKISKGALQALVNRWYTIAGNKECLEKYKGEVVGLEKRWAASYNWDLTGPCNVFGDVVAYGHTSDWTNNYMNEERYNLVVDLLNSEEFDFRFIEEM